MCVFLSETEFSDNLIIHNMFLCFGRYRGRFFELTKDTEVDWSDDVNRDLLRSMMMTASDVAAITKPWDVQKKVGSTRLESGHFLNLRFNRSGLDLIKIPKF